MEDLIVTKRNYEEMFMIKVDDIIKKNNSGIISFINSNLYHLLHEMLYMDVFISLLEKYDIDVISNIEHTLSRKILRTTIKMIKNIDDIKFIIKKVNIFEKRFINFSTIDIYEKLSDYAYGSFVMLRKKFLHIPIFKTNWLWYDAKNEKIKCFYCKLDITLNEYKIFLLHTHM